MSFLNTLLLGGAAALLAPLLIHLLNRSQFQTVSWGAMHLLDAALESNSRRVQWESWLMLLIRCLIPVLLAVALARPVFNHLQSSASELDASVCLLIDNSLSMAASEQGESLLARAAGEMSSMAGQSRRAELELWTTASPIRSLTTKSITNLPRLAAALQQIGPAAGVSWPLETLQLASQLASSSQAADRQIILASDFQSALWSGISENELQAVRNQLISSQPPTQLFLLPLRTSGELPNLSVHWEDAPRTARRDQPYQIIVRVTNHGPQAVGDIEVTFQVRGKDLGRRTLQLPAGASEQVPFACEFTEFGWQYMAVSLNDKGSVRGDDQCFHAVQVVAPPRVLIIDDSLSPTEVTMRSTQVDGRRSFAGTSRYLSLALAPFMEPEQNPFLLNHTRTDRVNRDTLAPYDVVILAQVEAVTSSLSDNLATYVDSGGGLLLFASPASDSAVWKSLTETTAAWLPMRWSQPHETTESEPAKLVLENRQLESEALSQALTSGAESFEFTRWWELIPKQNAHQVQVIASLSSGDPWLAEQRMGPGLVIQCASGCADDGNNLPTQPAYVPVMLSLTERLAFHSARSAQLSTGQSVAFQALTTGPLEQAVQAATDATLMSENTLSVELIAPTRSDESLPTVSRPTWQVPVQQGRGLFADTRLPGVYQAQLLSAEAAPITVEPGLFSLNPPPNESQLKPFSHTELKSLAARLGATLIESSQDYVRREKVRREGWEFWRWMLLAVLGLLFAELFIGLRGARTSGRGI